MSEIIRETDAHNKAKNEENIPVKSDTIKDSKPDLLRNQITTLKNKFTQMQLRLNNHTAKQNELKSRLNVCDADGLKMQARIDKHLEDFYDEMELYLETESAKLLQRLITAQNNIRETYIHLCQSKDALQIIRDISANVNESLIEAVGEPYAEKNDIERMIYRVSGLDNMNSSFGKRRDNLHQSGQKSNKRQKIREHEYSGNSDLSESDESESDEEIEPVLEKLYIKLNEHGSFEEKK